MIFESIVGVLLGCLTGLIPGIHPNTISAFISVNSHSLAILLVSMGVAHTFLNIIPATFVGVPEEDTALTIFPAHELVNRGEGSKAVSISAFSSLFSAIISLPLFYAVAAISGYDFSLLYKPTILAALIFFLYCEKDPFGGSLSGIKKKLNFLLVFTLSGILGIFSLSMGEYFFPLLTGLFATPMLLQSAKSERILEQRIIISFPKIVDVVKGVTAGLFVSLFPGISSGVATGIASSNSKSPEGYIASISSANTSAAILSLAMLYSGKVRSGIAGAVKSFAGDVFFLIPLFILTSALISTAICLILIHPASKLFSKINVGKLSLLVLISLSVFSLLLSGITGLTIFFFASTIGVLSYILRVRPISCMGSIMLPVLLR